MKKSYANLQKCNRHFDCLKDTCVEDTWRDLVISKFLFLYRFLESKRAYTLFCLFLLRDLHILVKEAVQKSQLFILGSLYNDTVSYFILYKTLANPELSTVVSQMHTKSLHKNVCIIIFTELCKAYKNFPTFQSQQIA